jgi:hypothetical protein
MPATRHLQPTAAEATLNRGRSVEQLLYIDQGTVSWLTIVAKRDGAFALSLHHVVDVGSPDFRDVTEFPPMDEEEYPGEGREVGTFDDAAQAIRAAATFGAVAERWVNEGLIDAEYSSARGF